MSTRGPSPLLPAAALLVIAVLPARALGQEQRCSGSYTETAWIAEMDAVDADFASFDADGARARLSDAHRWSLCLDAPVHPSTVARHARQLALAFFFDQDEDATRRWGLLARYAAPGLGWPADLDESHPFRMQVEEAADPPLGGPVDQQLAPPKKGAILLNGHLLTVARAPAEVPGFVQVVDGKQALVRQYWQDGAAFPDDLLLPGSAVAEAPKWYVEEQASDYPDLTTPLFGGAVASAADPEATDEPAAPEEPVADAAPEPPAVPDWREGYVDPFEDARLRAIARDVQIREELSGNVRRTIRTEVVTFATTEGKSTAVTNADYREWLYTRPDWAREFAVTGGRVGKRYLDRWKGDAPPADLGAVPVVWVPWNAASAYCDDWGGGLAAAEVADPPLVVDEWRQIDGAPALRRASGEVVRDAVDPKQVSESIGFRCQQ